MREHNRNDWSASLGGSLGYRGLTRPIEQLIAGGEGQRFQQASVEDALVAPSAGADMTVEHLKRLENQRRGYAQVSELSARLDAGRIDADIGGDLLVASRKDQVNNLSVDVDARLSRERNPQGFNNALAALAGPAGDKLTGTFGKQVSKVDPSLSPTLKLDVSQVQRDTVSEQASLSGRDEVQLNVGGNLKLEGAKLQSGKGQVEVQAASVTEQTLYGRDYRRDVAVDASNSPVDLGTALVDVINNTVRADGENGLDLGLLRTSGHSRSEEWVSSVGGGRR